MKNTRLLYIASQIFKVLLIKSYMLQPGFRWVLRRGLQAREKSGEVVRVEKKL